MKLSGVFLIILNLLLIVGLVVYMFNPLGDAEFSFTQETSSNFNLDPQQVEMQFYENMRFPEKRISYMLESDCSLQKKTSMREAFDLLENLTILDFYESPLSPEIVVSCQEKRVMRDGLFIAGEGGPTNITEGGKYNVILAGSILLIRDSECQRPNVEIHELLHVLGFNHSENDNNIMYPISKCRQTIGDDIVNRINELYLEDSYSDLAFEDAKAAINGRNLDLNLSIRNDGLRDSEDATIKIIADGDTIKEINLDSLEIGYGVKITLTNLWLKKIKIEELTVSIDSSEPELSKDNNRILLVKNTN